MGVLSGGTGLDVSVRAPGHVTPGERFEVSVEIGPWGGVAPTPLVLALESEERASLMENDAQESGVERHRTTRARVDLDAKPSARRGSRHACRFELTEDAPPSFQGVNAGTRYWLEVRPADGGGQPLARADLQVLPRRSEAAAGSPVSARSAKEDPDFRGPILELSLGTDVVQPGDVLTGAFSLGNLAYNRFSGVDLWLLLRETATSHGRSAVTEGHHRPRLATFPVPLEGLSVPFEVVVPRGLFPTWRSKLWRQDWLFELRATRFRDAVVRVPITVLAPAAPGGSRIRGAGAARRPPGAPPPVGSARVEALWKEVGAGEGLAFDGQGVLRGERAGVAISVRRQPGKGRGTLLGELSYAPLHLGLEIRPEGSLAALFGRGLRVGDPGWDRRHLLRGREQAQIETFLRGPVLAVLRALTLVAMDDEMVRAERSAVGETAAELAPFVKALAKLAVAIATRRAQIPPPAALAKGEAAWRALAAELGGPLETARMAVTGRRGGMEASVTTDWTIAGEPLQTTVALRPAWPIPSRAEGRFGGAKAAATPPEAWLPDAWAVCRALLDGAHELDVRTDMLALMLPAPLEDPAPALEKLDLLARLAAALRAERGPYR